jgi:hypothetical protein
VLNGRSSSLGWLSEAGGKLPLEGPSVNNSSPTPHNNNNYIEPTNQKQTNKQTNKQRNERTNEQRNERTNNPANLIQKTTQERMDVMDGKLLSEALATVKIQLVQMKRSLVSKN